jgi:hypothetical protein
MRKLTATVFNYSLDGLLADEGTDFWSDEVGRQDVGVLPTRSCGLFD